MLWKAYKYLYYQTYVSNLSWGKLGWGSWSPQWSVVGMGFTFVLYVFAVVMLLSFFGFHQIVDEISLVGRTFAIFIGPVLHYFLFLHNGRYKKIIKEFKPLDDVRFRKRGKLILRMYELGSMFSFATAGFLMAYSVNTGFTVIGYVEKLLGKPAAAIVSAEQTYQTNAQPKTENENTSNLNMQMDFLSNQNSFNNSPMNDELSKTPLAFTSENE